MPQILKSLDQALSPELNQIVDKMVESALPALNSGSWASKLEEKGLSVDSLAEQFVEALSHCKPAQKVKAISELLQDLGVTKKAAEVKVLPSIVINGENVSLQQLILPERKF